MDKKIDFSKGVKIIISPAEGGYACGIINEKIDMSDDSVYLCHIVAQGMIKFAMEHPQDAFDLGLEQVNNLEESKTNGQIKQSKDYDNVVDITELLKKRKLH